MEIFKVEREFSIFYIKRDIKMQEVNGDIQNLVPENICLSAEEIENLTQQLEHFNKTVPKILFYIIFMVMLVFLLIDDLKHLSIFESNSV